MNVKNFPDKNSIPHADRPLIRIFLVEDHKLVLKSMKMLIDQMEGIKVCMEAETGQDFLQLAQCSDYDLVLLDYGLPDGNADLHLMEFRKTNSTPVLVMSGYNLGDEAINSLRDLTNGFISKGKEPFELEAAIRTVVGHSNCQQIVESNKVSTDESGAVVTDALSPQERKVLDLYIQGKGTREIADSLCIREKTVLTYKYRMLSKTKSKNLAELVNKVMILSLLACFQTLLVTSLIHI
ncbi:MAG: response regulator transcription factor [Candidatus Wallbacteria bacterium]|nr:response regulator transcription factor [Candidatus Wallbacteria bacterium]